MKNFKILLFAVIVLFIHSVAYSQSITVTSPNGGENWVKGTTHNITWTSSGITSGTFTVRLFDGTTSIGIIQAGIPCTDGVHSIPWTVGNLAGGGTASPGSNFKIKVRQASLAPNDFSDAPFTISESGGGPTGSITVTNPHTGDTWYKGKPYTITWTKVGTTGVNVKINIFINSITPANFVEQLKGPNSESMSWTIPNSYATGTYYIRIKGVDSSWNDVGVYGDSSAFTIRKKITFKPIKPIKIKIIKPNKSSLWDEGKSYYIEWENSLTKHKPIAIDLYNSSGKKFIKNIKTIIPKKPKLMFGKISRTKWTIPKGTFKLFKTWRIKITRFDNPVISGLSDIFYIRKSSSVKKHKIYGTTYNKVKWSKKRKKEFCHYETPAAGPGAGKMRVGYENFDNDTTSSSYIYRSYLMFNTSQLKGLVLSAKLRYKVFMGSAGCITKISNVDGDWTTNFFGVPISQIQNPEIGLKGFIQVWLNDPGTNHGLLVSGAEENFKQWGNNSCMAFAEDVYLELEILE